uniref:Uncharacterized protein n=1 Tax=Oryza barthii TaxID=65489 RepID=A0A0D3ERM9_9ORYZ
MPAIHDLYTLRQSSRAMQTSITEITARLARVTELVLALRAGGDVGNYDDDALSAAHTVDSGGAVATRDDATFSAIAPVRGYGGGTGDDDALFTAIGPIGGVVIRIRGGGSDVIPHSSPVSLGTINSTVAMEDYHVASSPFPSTTTAATRDLTTASFSGVCDYAERCSTTRSIACGSNGVGSRQAMRAGKEGTAAAAQREQHARQSPGAPPPTRAAGMSCVRHITMAQLVPTSIRHGTCGIMVDTYTGLVPAVSWLIPTGFRPGTCGIMVDVSGTS